MITQLTTPHLILRKARHDDLDMIWKNIWSDGKIAETMLWKVTETREDALQRMERTLKVQASNHAFFVCLKETDEPVGFAGIRETAPGEFEETGLCIARRFQNRGFGKEVLSALIDLAFRRLGGHRFLYGCFHENAASAAVCRSCGFVYMYSRKAVRDWDGYEYLCDFYELVNEGGGRTMNTIYLAGGCFWGVQKFFDQFDGVIRTEVGYANGPADAPSYRDVCNDSGHAETVRIDYDSSRISLTDLLNDYFMVIDPLSVNRQGHDHGIQYRTGVYYTDESQLPEIQAVFAAEEKKAGAKLAVELEPLRNFFSAEEYHQKYLVKNPGGYCHIADHYFRMGK